MHRYPMSVIIGKQPDFYFDTAQGEDVKVISCTIAAVVVQSIEGRSAIGSVLATA